MRKHAIVISLAFVATSLALAPTAARAERFHGGAGSHRGAVGRSPFVPHRFFHHRGFASPFIPFGLIASPVVVYAAPPVYYGPPASYDSSPYYDRSVVYAPPAAYARPFGGPVSVAPSAPPTPNVVQYPNGRYELRGDGVLSPYIWVWIPNPPPPPPPAGAPPPGGPNSGATSPERHSKVYSWTDGQGVVHFTDRLDSVPEQYRTQSKPPKPS